MIRSIESIQADARRALEAFERDGKPVKPPAGLCDDGLKVWQRAYYEHSLAIAQ